MSVKITKEKRKIVNDLVNFVKCIGEEKDGIISIWGFENKYDLTGFLISLLREIWFAEDEVEK